MTVTRTAKPPTEQQPHHDAGAQAERRHRGRRRQQDRPRGGPLRRRPGRRRPDAGRHPHHQRALRRRDHRRAGPAVDPDRRRDDRRGAGVLPAGRAAAGRLHRQGGPQPGRRLLQPVGRARPRRGADRRRDGRVRQGQRPQARLRRRPRRRPAVRVLRAAHGLRPLPAAPPRDPRGAGDPAVLPAAGGVRAGAEPGGGDRLLPADVVAGLPAEHPDPVQLRHAAHRRCRRATSSTPRATSSTRSTPLRAGGQAVEVRRRHRDLRSPGSARAAR